MTWIHRAACKDIADPDQFFPVARPGAPLLDSKLAEATTICQRAGHFRYGRAPGDNRPAVTAEVSA